MKRSIRRIIAAAAFIGVLAQPLTAYCMPKFAYTYTLPVSAAANRGTEIGTEIGHCQERRFKIGGGLLTIQSINYGNQYQATGTNTCGPALPYTRVSTVNPAIVGPMVSTAQSLGYQPSAAFDLEIGGFTNYAGFTPNSQLYLPMNYEMFVCPVAGYQPAMMVLLPNGTFRLLNDSEFDRSYSGSLFVDGSQKFVLHTYFPKGIYMLVYIRQ